MAGWGGLSPRCSCRDDEIGGSPGIEAKTMSITFNANIIINGSSAGNLASMYEGQVRDNLLSIMMFDTGRAVVHGFERAGRRLTIVPWLQQSQNADSGPTNWRNGTLAGEPVRGGNGVHHQAWGAGT